MIKSADVCVVGLGAMGSAAAHHLSARGARVIGLEAFARGHVLGSSGGLSRIIRMAYSEHPDYVPLLRRAWQLWVELERATGERLLRRTGGLYLGTTGGDLVSGARRSAREHELAHEALSAAEVIRRYPALRPDPSWSAVYEPQAGVLAPERCIEAHLSLAERAGAELRFGVRGERWGADGGGVLVETSAGLVRADRLVVTAGAWLGRLLPHVAPLLRVERVPLFWFDAASVVGELPVWIAETADDGSFYGLPPDEHGIKVARHGSGESADPDTVDRSPRAADEARVRRFTARYIPAADTAVRRAHVCMYTVTPDEHFVIDRHGDGVVYASACSGHGFKFATVVGEILADLALAGATAHPIGFLSASRFPALAAPSPA